MSFFPVYLKIAGKRILVVGGGKVAERKVYDILQGGGEVYVLSPYLSDGLTFLLKEGRINWIAEEFSTGLLPEEVFLIIAATDDAEINRRVFDYARSRGILINVVDEPEMCDFYVPSVVRKGDLMIAISTGGRAPSFSRAFREFLEGVIPDDVSRALEYLSDIRNRLKENSVPERGKILLDSAREMIGRLAGGASWGEVREEVEKELEDEI